MKKLACIPGCALLVLLCACSSSEPAKKAEEKPPEPVTGLTALYRMYAPARQWAPDAQVLRMRSIPMSEVKPERGKAAAWEANFASPSRGKARGWTYSVVEGQGNLHQGAFAGLEANWSGPQPNARPIPLAAVKTDTDAAYQTALKNKGAEYDKKNPGRPINFVLENTGKFPDASWRVIWGESAGSSNFSVFVDISTGLFQETLR